MQLKLAVDLIKEKSVNGVCTLSKKKLGEVLHSRHPSNFRDSEHARATIRKATGSSGKTHREKIKTTIEWNGFRIGKPEKNDFSKVVLSQKKIGILSDIHFPYYDKAALTSATKYLQKFQPDCIVLNGDIIDCYQLSNFDRDPRKRKFIEELKMVRKFIIQLIDLFPQTRIIFKLGNHCERYERVILNRVPELIDLELFTFNDALHYKQPFKIEVITNKRLMKAGHLNIGHGHEFAKGFIQSVNPARGFFIKSKSNFIGGHHHRTSEHVEQDINGKIIACWSTGCLSELNPHYCPINNWNSGFATVEMDGQDFMVKNLKIINGKVF